MQAAEVLGVVDALAGSGLRAWLDGGWGVDALLGQQTRDHDDLDIVIELVQVEAVVRAVAPLGFLLVTDRLPTRAVLQSPDGRQLDLHPVTFDPDGVGWQQGAAPDGSDCPYPADGFGQGSIAGRLVPCLTAELQVAHHCGYDPRPHDRQDMAALAATFGLALPKPY